MVKSKTAAKIVTMFGDVTGLQQRHHQWNIPYLVDKIKGFPLKTKSFRITATYQKLEGWVLSIPPPPGIRMGVWLRVRPTVKDAFPNLQSWPYNTYSSLDRSRPRKYYETYKTYRVRTSDSRFEDKTCLKWRWEKIHLVLRVFAAWPSDIDFTFAPRPIKMSFVYRIWQFALKWDPNNKSSGAPNFTEFGLQDSNSSVHV